MGEGRAGAVVDVPFWRRPGVVVDVADALVVCGDPVGAGAGDGEDVVVVAADDHVGVQKADFFRGAVQRWLRRRLGG